MPTDWRARVWAEFRAGNLTRTMRDVLLTLYTYRRGPGGLAWPAHATLADRVGCSIRTVARALAMARQLGLVSWTERRVRAGWRWLRTSNAYRLIAPRGAVQAGQRRPTMPPVPRLPTTGQDGRGGEREKHQEALKDAVAAAMRLPDLLAARREVFARQWGAQRTA